MFKQSLKVAALVFAMAMAACGQQSRWAAADDPTAKFIVDAERQWAEGACTHNGIEAKILADDFQGTSPRDGSRYTRADELARAVDRSHSATDCRLLEAKVRFFGENLAMVYGRETATRKENDGNTKPHCLTWTDTWLKRNGKWQIIAAQDALFPCK